MFPENFSINSAENKAISIIKISSLTCNIVFPEMLINRELNNLNINSICDKSGNCAQNTQTGFTPVWARTGDVVISESWPILYPKLRYRVRIILKY